MAETKIKAAQFSGVIGNGTDGYVLTSTGDGNMEWAQTQTPSPVVTSLAYSGSLTAADPAGGETVTITGSNFITGASVTIGGTAAPSVSFVSATTLTITTPAKAAGDYDVVVTNTNGGAGTKINGISYNGVPAWTTAAGSLGTFASNTTISTITLQASEPDAGTITFDITNGALPTGLSLTGADIDGTTTLETADTLYTFTVTATDDENQSTPRTFTITVTKQFINTENFTINTYTGNGSTQSIEGKIGTAASFNGSSSQIDISDSLGMGVNDFAYSFWFKSNAPTANEQAFMQVLDQHVNYGVKINSTYTLTSAPTNSSGGTQYIGTNNITLDTDWHHVAYTKSSTAGHSLWYDGTKVAEDTSFTGDVQATTGIITLGSATNDIAWFNGYLDQVRFFNKGLSSSEISTLAAESNTSTTKSTTDIFDDGSGVALYEFEEGAKDTGGVNGYIGAAGVFNGSNTYIQSTSLGSKFAGNNTLSVSLWFKSTTDSHQSLFNFSDTGDASTEMGLRIRGDVTGDQIGIFNRNGGSYNIEANNTGTGSVIDGDWHHVVLTGDSNGHKLYFDGSELTSIVYATGSSSTTLSVPSDINSFSIGANIDSSGAETLLNGEIDQVRIFNKAISSSEVTTLYQETSASATKSTTDIFDDGSAVALYELEGNANDTGLYGRGAIDSGQSAVFNGSSSYIDTNAKIPASLDFSFSFWFKSTSTATNQYIFSTKGNSATNGWWIQSNAGTIRYGEGNGSNNGVTQTSPASTYADGSWHHVVVTRASGGTVNMYIDGDQVITDGSVGVNYMTSSVWAHDLHIGRYAASALYYFNGSLDQVRIYSSVLSASDVEALVSETNVPTANLVAHYKLDGNANDETTNYNGTATSITYSDPAEYPTYDGTATNVSYAYDGTPTNVSFVGTSFQPDFVWVKSRAAGSHIVTDSVRGNGKELYPDLINQEGIVNRFSLTSNGFDVTTSGYGNAIGVNYVAWCWKAGGSVTPNNNTDGDITSTVSANQDAGFSIATWSGDDTASNIGHGLGGIPELMIIKNRTGTNSWIVGVPDVLGTGYLILNDYGVASTSNVFGQVPDSTRYYFNTAAGGNGHLSTGNYVGYFFRSITEYQKVGSYLGSSSTVTVTTGFEPRFVMIKRTNAIADWILYDQVRSGGTDMDDYLTPNSTLVEQQNSAIDITAISTGFTVESGNWQGVNTSGGEYIYLAIA